MALGSEEPSSGLPGSRPAKRDGWPRSAADERATKVARRQQSPGEVSTATAAAAAAAAAEGPRVVPSLAAGATPADALRSAGGNLSLWSPGTGSSLLTHEGAAHSAAAASSSGTPAVQGEDGGLRRATLAPVDRQEQLVPQVALDDVGGGGSARGVPAPQRGGHAEQAQQAWPQLGNGCWQGGPQAVAAQWVTAASVPAVGGLLAAASPPGRHGHASGVGAHGIWWGGKAGGLAALPSPSLRPADEHLCRSPAAQPHLRSGEFADAACFTPQLTMAAATATSPMVPAMVDSSGGVWLQHVASPVPYALPAPQPFTVYPGPWPAAVGQQSWLGMRGSPAVFSDYSSFPAAVKLSTGAPDAGPWWHQGGSRCSFGGLPGMATAAAAAPRPPFKKPPPLVLLRDSATMELRLVTAEERDRQVAPAATAAAQGAAASSSDEDAQSAGTPKAASHSQGHCQRRGGGGGGRRNGGGGAGGATSGGAASSGARPAPGKMGSRGEPPGSSDRRVGGSGGNGSDASRSRSAGQSRSGSRTSGAGAGPRVAISRGLPLSRLRTGHSLETSAGATDAQRQGGNEVKAAAPDGCGYDARQPGEEVADADEMDVDNRAAPVSVGGELEEEQPGSPAAASAEEASNAGLTAASETVDSGEEVGTADQRSSHSPRRAAPVARLRPTLAKRSLRESPHQVVPQLPPAQRQLRAGSGPPGLSGLDLSACKPAIML